MKHAAKKPHSLPTARAECLEQQFQELPSGLTYQEIAQRLGISYPIARAWAKRLDYPARCLPRGRPSGREQRVNQMLGLPEDLTVVEVAQRLKISVTVAYYWIRQTGYQFRRAPGSGRWNEKVVRDRWSKVDWSLSNIEIAKSVGVSRERVRQVRAQHHAPNGGS